MSMHARARVSGFSFIELVIALMILAVLTLFVGPNLIRYVGESRRSATENNLQQLKLSIQQFQFDTGKYPQTLNDLVQAPANVKNWRGPYIDPDNVEKALNDGWKVPFVYQQNPAGAKGGRPYQLYSWGSNGEGSEQSEWISVWDV